MAALLEGVIDQQYVPVVSWLIIGAIALILLYVAYRVLRLVTSGTFIAGGRNRRTRLAVMDATAVDDKRRLVLVRRDDVEHLILIGGPTDVVVEQDIRMIPRSARPADAEQAPEGQDMGEEPRPSRPVLPVQPRAPQRDFRSLERAPVQRAPGSARPNVTEPVASVAGGASTPAPAAPAPAAAPQPAPAAAQPAPPVRPAATQPPRPAATQPPRPVTSPPTGAAPQVASPVRPAPPAEPRREPSAGAPPAPRQQPATAAPRPAAAPANDLDDALLHELETSLRQPTRDKVPSSRQELDDEMSKLLGELSRDRR